MCEDILQDLAQVVIDGDNEYAAALAQRVVEQGLDAQICVEKGLVKGIEQVGGLVDSGEYFLPDVIKSAEAMEAALQVLEPALTSDRNREIITLVLLRPMDGDQDENGKFLLGTMLNSEENTDNRKLPFVRWLTS